MAARSGKRLSVGVAIALAMCLLAGSAGAAEDVFDGTGAGAIPDGLSGTPPQFGPSLDVTFAVSGLLSNVTAVRVAFTATHTWVGDVDAVLTAPGGAPSLVVVSRIGVTTAGSFGDSSNYNGTYTFTDDAGPTALDHIWSKALGSNGNPPCADTCDIPAASYRTTEAGFTGQTNPPPLTSLNTTFVGLTPDQANGTWTLSFRDAGELETGSVSAASLTIVTGAAEGPYDIDGDGAIEALTDGLLLVRYFFGFRDAALINNAVNLDDCTRCSAEAIQAHIASFF